MKALTKKQKAEESKKKAVQKQTLELQHEIFFKLMKVPQFVGWFEKNIRVSHDIDQEKKTIGVTVLYVGDQEDQHIVKCPGCQLSFDADAETNLISLATSIPEGNPEN